MPGFIAVHCGAGEQKTKNYAIYNKLSKRACSAGIKVLNDGGNATEAVKAAVIVLENNPITNAGYGSNLTINGIVETDASIMDGTTLHYGGCGAVRKVKNPIELAYDICDKQRTKLPLGLIPPSLLVGKGALDHAKAADIKVLPNKQLITPKTWRQYKKYKTIFRSCSLSNRLDTVGAVCIDNCGNIASAASSGGILLKRPGRVGQAALYGSGVWADSYDPDDASIAVCTTGCGEYLMQTLLAKEIATDLKQSTFPTIELHSSMTEKFLNSRHLAKVDQKLGGALVLHKCKSGDGSILWCHTTLTMSVGYMSQNDPRPKALISVLPDKTDVGSRVTVGGANFIHWGT